MNFLKALKKLRQTPDQSAPASVPAQPPKASKAEWDGFFDETMKDEKEGQHRQQTALTRKTTLKPRTAVVSAKPVRTAAATLWAGLRLAALFVIVSGLLLCAGVIGLAWKATVATAHLASDSINTSVPITAPQPQLAAPPTREAPNVVPTPPPPPASPQIVPSVEAPLGPVPHPIVNLPAPLAEVENWVPQATLGTSGTNPVSEPNVPRPGYTWVKGYARADGTIVDGHWRKKRATSATPSTPTAPVFSSSNDSGGRVWVDGYTRKDGTKVKGYWRSK